MSRVVIGHKDGKPIYRDEGPNIGHRERLGPLDRGISGPRRPGRSIGLPDEKQGLHWDKREI